MRRGKREQSGVEAAKTGASAPSPSTRWVLWVLVAILLLTIAFDLVFYTGFCGADDLQYLRGATEIAETGKMSSLTLGTIRIVLLLPLVPLIRLTNHHIFALTASFAVYHLLLVAGTYCLGSRLHGNGTGLLAAGSIAVLPVVAGLATTILPEHAMAALVVFAVIALHAAGDRLCSSPRRLRAGYALALAAGFLFALAAAAKVVAVILLPVLAVLVLSWFRKAPASAVVKAGLLFLLGALVCAAMVSLCFHALTGLYTPFQNDVFAEKMRGISERPVGGGLAAPGERLARLVSFARRPSVLGVFLWAVPASVVVYPMFRRRSWFVVVAFIWICAYMTWGSFSLTSYRPVAMRVRYYILALPFAAVMWSFLVHTALGSLWQRLGALPRLRPVMVGLASVLALAVIANCAAGVNQLAGKPYLAPEAAGVRYALDFAANGDDRPVVLSHWLSVRLHPLFRRGRHPRLVLTDADAGTEEMRDSLVTAGFLYVDSAFERSSRRSYPKTPSPLDQAVAEARAGMSPDLRVNTIGTFAQFRTRLSAFRYVLGGFGADMDLRDDERRVFLQEVTRPQRQAQPIADGAGHPVDLSAPDAYAPTWVVRVDECDLSQAHDGSVRCTIQGSGSTAGGQYGGIRFPIGPVDAVRLDVTFDTPETIAAVFLDITGEGTASSRLRWQFVPSADLPVPCGLQSYTFRLDQSTGPFAFVGGGLALQECQNAHLFVRLKGLNSSAAFRVHRVVVQTPAE